MTFSQKDHEDLTRAAAIVNEVMDRHPSRDLRVISALCSAIQGIHVAELYDDHPSRIGS